MRRALPIALVCTSLSGAARADIDARRFAPLLGPHHALADEEGRLPLLVRLPENVDPRSRGLLPVAPGLGAIHLPAGEVAAFAAALGERVTTAPLRRPLLDRSGDWTHVPAFRKATGTGGRGVVVGIIDTGLDVAHPDFRDESGSRVAWMLHREDPRHLHPELEQRFGCTDPNQSPCAIFSKADLDALIAKGEAPGDTAGHGTHVTSIAAGNGGTHYRRLHGLGVTRKYQGIYVGMAPKATIVVASPSSTGFSDPDILNAARFIFDRADALGLPAVVNVSLGSDFGPHDGTSDLERGLAAMVGDSFPGRAIVVAAGNSGDTAPEPNGIGAPGIHTEVSIFPHSVTRVPIVSSDTGTSKGAGFVWLTFDRGDEVEVALDGPDAATIGFIAQGDDRGWHDDNVRAGIVNNEGGLTGNIAPDSNSAVVYWNGSWEAASPIALRLKGHGHAEMWVSGSGSADHRLKFERGVKSGTIAVPASDPNLIAVGCTVNRTAWPYWGNGKQLMPPDALDQDGICFFSAAGPNRNGVMKPDILAPGDFVVAAMSSLADPRSYPDSLFDPPGCGDSLPYCYVTDDHHAVTGGTSMAAPHVSGAIALLLEKNKMLTQRQVLQLLQASVSRPTGHLPFEPQNGPGQLDMLGVLQLLDGEPLATEASVAKSWYTMAAAYLRPDPAYPARALVELRDAGGSIVGTVPSGALALHVAGARVAEPLERVAPGLWRFAIAAEHGSGGSQATVEVLYRGRSLGLRVLPIAADPWQIGGAVNPVGGCSVAGARPSSWLGPAAMLLAIVALGSRRRARGHEHAA